MKDEHGFKESSIKAMEEFLNSFLMMKEKTKSIRSTNQELSLG